MRLDMEDHRYCKGETMKRICCLVFARLESTRVPNKLLQDVGGRTLLDRGIDYLVKLREACPNVTPMVCYPTEDAPIREACKAEGIKTVADEVQSSSWPELIKPAVAYLQSHYDWVWDANVFCHPFLRVETGRKIVERMGEKRFIKIFGYEGTKPFVVTHENRGVVWADDGQHAKIGFGQLANTKTNAVYHQLAHVAYCWPVKCLDMSEPELAITTWPFSIPLHWSELIDIDTPDDLEHARIVAKGAGW